KRTAVLTVVLLAVGFLAACASPHDGAAASAPGRAAGQAVAQRSVIVVNCLGQQQTRPSSFILTCADAGDVLTGLHWIDWASTQAFGTGTEMINTCKPNCAEGKFVSYPVLITLWRSEPLPGHPGVLYFTRITRIYTAKRPPLYYCQGTHTCYPLTSTSGLWSTQINA
ncbi:MAG: hypothetical protein ACRDOE_19995, partial [Streptosporangiaceae bacterium]